MYNSENGKYETFQVFCRSFCQVNEPVRQFYVSVRFISFLLSKMLSDFGRSGSVLFRIGQGIFCTLVNAHLKEKSKCGLACARTTGRPTVGHMCGGLGDWLQRIRVATEVFYRSLCKKRYIRMLSFFTSIHLNSHL